MLLLLQEEKYKLYFNNLQHALQASHHTAGVGTAASGVSKSPARGFGATTCHIHKPGLAPILLWFGFFIA